MDKVRIKHYPLRYTRQYLTDVCEFASFFTYYPPLILIFAENYNQKHPHVSPNNRTKTGKMMRRGRIEVICGSMFSGKTEELIRRLKRAEFARQKRRNIQTSIDTRYAEQDVVSHEGNSIPSNPP